MNQVLDPATMIEAAQAAAAAGDYPTAERLLCEAAASQEATLGSVHPDLASTLNNLALVYEQTNKIAEAEQSYRRAHAIAVASLLPGHPFVATSLKNLVDFCEARDIPLWRPPAARPDIDIGAPASGSPPEHAVAISVLGADSLEADFSSDAAHRHSEAVPFVHAAEPSPAPRRKIALVGLAAAAVVVISIVMRWSEASPASGSPAPASTTAPVASEPARAIPVESRPDATPAPEPVTRVEPAEPRETGALAPLTVFNAQLCRAIEKRGSPDWQCTAASGDLQPGTYTFYTRVGTSADATVEHRWYRDDRLHQVVRLRIAPNASSGYRTFSSTTISAERTGNWRVEARAADGALLQEERFVVVR